MTPNKIIFLNGPPACGKDTVGKIIAKRYGAQLFKAAAPLRQAVGALIGCEDSAIEGLKSAPIKLWAHQIADMTVRDLMIALSEEVVKPALGQEWFGYLLGESIAKAAPPLAVVTDAGFIPEVEACCRELPGWDVELWRIHRSGCDFTGDSRSWVKLERDHLLVTLINDGSLSELEARVTEVFERS